MIDEATDLQIQNKLCLFSIMLRRILLWQKNLLVYIKQMQLIHNRWLLRMNLRLQYCCGQCYDGVSNMRGSRNGVAKIITDEEPCAVYTHC